MTQRSRHDRICELLHARGECSVDELGRALGVSGMTIRRDLRALAAEGKAIRTHGGAAVAQRISFEFSFLERVNRCLRRLFRSAGAFHSETGLLACVTCVLAPFWPV